MQALSVTISVSGHRGAPLCRRHKRVELPRSSRGTDSLSLGRTSGTRDGVSEPPQAHFRHIPLYLLRRTTAERTRGRRRARMGLSVAISNSGADEVGSRGTHCQCNRTEDSEVRLAAWALSSIVVRMSASRLHDNVLRVGDARGRLPRFWMCVPPAAAARHQRRTRIRPRHWKVEKEQAVLPRMDTRSVAGRVSFCSNSSETKIFQTSDPSKWSIC